MQSLTLYFSFCLTLIRFISSLDLRNSCYDIDTYRDEIYIYYYSGIPIDITILCILKYMNVEYHLGRVQIEDLSYIRRIYKGECRYSSDYSSYNIVYDRLDSKLDFPIGYGEYADLLRGRILSCLDDTINWNTSTKSHDEIYLGLARNTIDYFAGLTKDEYRSEELTKSNLVLSEFDHEIQDFQNLNFKYYPTRTSISKYEGSDRILRSRDLQFDIYPMLNYLLNLFFTSVAKVHELQSRLLEKSIYRQISKIMIGTNNHLAIGTTILGLISTQKSFSDKTLRDIDKSLIESQKIELESRKLYLENMRLMLESSISTNKILMVISSALDNIITKLEEIENELENVKDELEKVNDQLKEINKKLDALTGDSDDSSENPDEDSDGEVECSEPEDEDLKSEIMQLWNELNDKFDSLKCDDFKGQREIIQDICFMYFMLENERDEISNQEYILYRFDSTSELLLEDHSSSCLMIGGNHPKFSSMYYDRNLILSNDLYSISELNRNDYLNDLSKVHLMLFKEICRSYDVYWYQKFFNLIRKNRGLNHSTIPFESMQDIIFEVSTISSLCLE